MAKITIRNMDNREIISNDNSTSILNIIQDAQIDWMHACGGKGRCTTCKMVIHSGIDTLAAPNEAEQKLIDLGRLAHNERLSCQNRLQDDLEISVAEQNKFPHLNYTA
jgi:2Fe-2S ferredoxin